MEDSRMRGCRTIFPVFIFCGGLFFYFVFMMPPISDNYIFSLGTDQLYSEIMAGNPVRVTQPLVFSDIWTRSVQMYESWDGRFTGNMLMTLFLYIPHAVYAVWATLLFLVYIFVLHICVFGTRWRENLTGVRVLTLAALLWVGLPSFGSAFFWICVGGANTLLCQAAFLLPYRMALDTPACFGEKRKNFSAAAPSEDVQHSGLRLFTESTASTSLFSFLFGLFGLFTAMQDYSTAAVCPVMAVGTLLYVYFRQKKGMRTWPRFLAWGATGIILGGILTIACPGNAKRILIEATYSEQTAIYLHSTFGEKVFSFIMRQPEALAMLVVPYALLLWGGWMLWRRYGRSAWRFVPASVYFWGVAALLAQGAYLFSPTPPPRAYATIAVQLILASYTLFFAVRAQAAAGTNLLLRAMQIFFILYCLISVPSEIIKFSTVHAEHQEREAVFVDNAGKDVCVPRFSVKADRHMVLGSHLQDIGYNPAFWVNRVVAAHYKLRSVRICPFAARHYVAMPMAGYAFTATVRQWGDPHPSVMVDSNLLRWQQRRDVGMEIALTAGPGKDQPATAVIYYYGKPALLSWFPDPVAGWVYDRLKTEGLGRWLIPLLYARTEASLRWEKDENGRAVGRGKAELHGFYEEKSPYFLVQPERKYYPFEFLFLKEEI